MITFLTLGPITFANFEIPEKINFGGSQALAIKQLVGGKRIVDAMGRVDDDISWSGLFFGSTSTFRAQFLDNMRVKGLPLPLTWGLFNYQVVIKDFKATFERYYQIPYSITCVVVQDLNKPFPVLVPVLYNDAIIAQLTEALDIANAIANPSVSNAMALLSVAINAVPNFDIATSGQIASVLAPLAVATQAVTGAIAATNLSIFGNQSGFLQATTPDVQADIVSSDLLLLSNLYLLESILININTNLSLISEGETGKTITIANANLYQLAAAEYGDPSQWVTIASANGLTDPYVSGGAITNIVVTTGGFGYSNPAPVFTGNQINPPNVRVNIGIGGAIVSIDVENGGLFTNQPQLTIQDPTGSGATFIVNCAQTLTIPQSSNSVSGGILTS